MRETTPLPSSSGGSGGRGAPFQLPGLSRLFLSRAGGSSGGRATTGGPSPGVPPLRLGSSRGVGGSSRSAEPRLRGRRKGSRGPPVRALRSSRPLRPPGPGPAFRGAGRRGERRPGGSQLIGRGSWASEASALCRGYREEGAPRGRVPRSRAGAADCRPGGVAECLALLSERLGLRFCKARRGGLIQ